MTKRTIELPDGAPFVDGRVQNTNPAAAAYASAIGARKGGLPKQDLPLGFGETRPPIPNLAGGPDQHTRGAHTMADYARVERGPEPVRAVPTPSIVDEPAPSYRPQPPATPRPTAASLGLAPLDILPAQAQKDPEYIEGHGAEMASNQPALAARYGVIRQGRYIPPQMLTKPAGGGNVVRPETLRDIEVLSKLQSQAPGLDETTGASKKAVEEGLGGAAGRVGNLPGDRDTAAPTTEEKERVLRSAIEQMDSFEFNQWRQLTMREILNSEKQRDIIEKRLQPLAIEQIITHGYVRQRIPIIPGKYEITLQSFDGQIELALKRLVMSESRSVDVGNDYFLDKYSFMSVAAGLFKVNETVYGEILDSNGVFDDKLFLDKFNKVMKLPIHMLASIGVNQMWFEMRVRKLYSATEVGNG